MSNPTGNLRSMPAPELSDGRRALLQRIAASAAFQKSNRAREFLLYVGERTLLHPDLPIRESEIGVEVFGRTANYDTSQDTLVRVQGSQLRKKLQQYFDEEGAAEPVVVEMPKGSYSLVFTPRAALLAASPRPVAARRWIAAAAVLALVCAALAVQHYTLRERADFGLGAQPLLNAFWRQLFANNLRTYLVLADANLVVFEDQIKQDISIQDYENKAFQRLAEERIADPQRRTLALNLVGRYYTSLADTFITRRFGLLSAANRISLDVVFARSMATSQLTAHNVILLGSRRANPWVGFYEPKLNFRTEFEEEPRVARFRNASPRPGEQPSYEGRWSRLGYCRVAYLPNSKGAGSVLILSGTDVPSSEAGGEFVSSEEWVRRLRRELALATGEPVPYFEALLRTEVVNSTVPKYEFVALRRH